jgi:hypothetical protein
MSLLSMMASIVLRNTQLCCSMQALVNPAHLLHYFDSSKRSIDAWGKMHRCR